jgi:hypothetical protein
LCPNESQGKEIGETISPCQLKADIEDGHAPPPSTIPPKEFFGIFSLREFEAG